MKISRKQNINNKFKKWTLKYDFMIQWREAIDQELEKISNDRVVNDIRIGD